MEEREFYELTNPQKSIYYTEQKYRGTTITNISDTVHIKTKIDFKKLILIIHKNLKMIKNLKL